MLHVTRASSSLIDLRGSPAPVRCKAEKSASRCYVPRAKARPTLKTSGCYAVCFASRSPLSLARMCEQHA